MGNMSQRHVVRAIWIAAVLFIGISCAGGGVSEAPAGNFAGGAGAGGEAGAGGDAGSGGEDPGVVGGGSGQNSGPDPNDKDEDGFRAGVDCDDEDPAVNPDADEVCNGIDDDCDDQIDVNATDAVTYYPDTDGDGLGNGDVPVKSCEPIDGYVLEQGDCDDWDKDVQEAFDGEFCVNAGSAAIFVAATGHDDNTGATPAEAVRTIPVGITRALDCPDKPCVVLVSEGEFPGQVVLPAGVDLRGGYKEGFLERNVGEFVSTIVSDAPKTVVADGVIGPLIVDGFTVQGATLTDPGATSYAVWIKNSRALTIKSSKLVGGVGGNGETGANGELLTCNARGGQGGVATDCNASRGASGDSEGDPVVAGGGGDGGSSNCPSACPLVGSDGVTSGRTGAQGGDGGDGAAGIPVANIYGEFNAGEWVGAVGGDGERGKHGTGGGGGGSGGSKKFRACFGCGTLLGGRGGDGGAGGCAGDGGKAGGSGGGAFGLVVVDSDLTLEDVSISGGTGGVGGLGGDGTIGSDGSQVVVLGHEEARSQKCGLIWYNSGSGGIGGFGGKGGTGAGGSGGPGGPGIALATTGISNIVRHGNVVLTPGLGGGGGPPGAGPGAPGNPGNVGAAVQERQY